MKTKRPARRIPKQESCIHPKKEHEKYKNSRASKTPQNKKTFNFR